MSPQSDNQKKSTVGDSFVFKYILSSLSAVVAESVTYPLDLTKTRLQIQGEVNVSGTTVSHSKRGMLKIMYGIATEEGIHKLWQGVTPALYRHVVYSGIRMSTYEFLRDKIFKKNPDGTFTLWKGAICGTLAGSIGQLVASPTDLVKVRMQMEGRRRLEGKPIRVKNAAHAFRNILAEGGVRALWTGWVPNVQRAALVNMGDLVTYDTVKHQLLKRTSIQDNYVCHGLSSACAGLVASIMCTPADVVKTRIMNQPTVNGKATFYKGSIDCLLKTVRQEGFFALYKGLFPTYCRMCFDHQNKVFIVALKVAINQCATVLPTLYKGSYDCLVKSVRNEGPRVLFKGFLPTWARLGPWFLVFWTTYEQFLKMLGSTF